MSKPTDKKIPGKSPVDDEAKPAGFHWEIRPEPAATPRDRRWLILSITTLVICFATLSWLAFR